MTSKFVTRSTIDSAFAVKKTMTNQLLLASSADLNGDFLCVQLFIEVFLRMKDFDDSKQEFDNVAYHLYDKDEHTLCISSYYYRYS